MGVYEAKSPQGVEFTVERLQKLVSECADEPAAKLIANVSEAVDTFTANCPKRRRSNTPCYRSSRMKLKLGIA